MGLEKYIRWEEFQEKKYYLYQVAKDWEEDTPGMRKFYEDPVKNPLGTPSKKLEFYSERLAKNFPDDKETAAQSRNGSRRAKCIDERLSSPRAKLIRCF